jgi:SAM-dependent methyltransferase
VGDERRAAEEAVRRCYSTWSTTYHDEYYGEGAAHPPVHRDLLLRLLADAGARDVLDAGCGPASFLRHLEGTGIRPFGFDLTPEMVAEARRVLGDDDAVWEGSALDPEAFHPPGDPGRRFDAAVCAGVLPHIPAGTDADVLGFLAGAVRPGGLVAATARNELFGLFTLNRYSRDLFHDLIDVEGLRAEALPEEAEGLEQGLAAMDARFRTDLPPLRTGEDGAPGYDEVLSRAHNPLALRDAAEAAGLREVRLLFLHFHRLPPLAGDAVPALQRRASLAMDADPSDPRGLVMASSVVVTGTAP